MAADDDTSPRSSRIARHGVRRGASANPPRSASDVPAASRWGLIESRAEALAATPPFKAWPADAIARLAAEVRVFKRKPGEFIVARGDPMDSVYLVVEGHTHVSVSSRGGRNIVFAVAPPTAAVFGVGSIVDGEPMGNDVVAEEPVVALALPVSAIRAELERAPELWRSLAQELVFRARFSIEQLVLFLFQPIRARAARLLLGLATTTGLVHDDQAFTIALKLPQERLGEMLGVSRQTATALVRELVADGLIQWRYGRVTLVDITRLRAIAAEADPQPTAER